MLAALIAAALFVGALAVWTYVLFPGIPIPTPQPKSQAQTSRIYAADGSVLATLHGEVNRQPVKLADLPRSVADAAVASEDARFYEHGGLDNRSIARALLRDLAANAWVQGGSTITQQYVKDAYVGNERSLRRKLLEARLARELERKLSKEQILELYLNTVYFGEGAYGIEAASQALFAKPAARLTLPEAAELIGLIPAPVRFSPRTSPEQAERRRLWVIDRMASLGFVSPSDAEAARAARPELAPPRPAVTSDEDAASAWFVDAVKRYVFARYGAERVLTGGLEIHTTLNPELQASAEKILARNLPDPSDPYAALASVDPATGYVRALVGGRDYAKEKYNIAVQGRRQPGSAFKPFVLVAALEDGISPSAVFSGPSTICLSGWKPDCRVRNFGSEGWGSITLTEATVHSVNTVFAQLILKVGPDKVVDVARRMGIPAPDWIVPPQVGCRPLDSVVCRTDLRPRPSLALGAQEVTPLEMASAYATLAAGGVHRDPKVVSKIVDRSGKVLEDGPSPGRQVLDPRVAEEATRILTGVIQRGTGRRADIGRPAAGKTGTAEDFRNAWFVGYTPDMATAVWTGYRDGNLPLLDVHGFAQVTGGTIPAMMWSQYMSDADVAVAQSPMPGPVLLGNAVSYRVTVANHGPWQAAGVTLDDVLPQGMEVVSVEASQGSCRAASRPLACDVGDLDAGATATVDVKLRPGAPGTFASEATVHAAGNDPSPGDNAARSDIVVVPAADLAVETATDPAPQLLGGTLTYTSTVTNGGPSPATGVALTQALPPSASLVSSAVSSNTVPARRGRAAKMDPSAGLCMPGDGHVACTLGDLPPGARATVTVVVRPDRPGAFPSAATVQATEADAKPDNDRSEAVATVVPAADLTLVGTAPPEPVPIGRQLASSFLARNAGPSDATGVVVTDILPLGSSLVSADASTGRCRQAGTTVTCDLGALPVGRESTVVVVVVPTSVGDATSEARLSAEEADPVPGGSVATTSSAVVASTDLSVSATAAPAVVQVGDDISYDVFVANAGLSPATGVTLTATLPESATFVSASAASVGAMPASCRVRDRTVVCTLGSLGVRERVHAVVVVRGMAGGPVVAGLDVQGGELDPVSGNNHLTVRATVATGSAGSPTRMI